MKQAMIFAAGLGTRLKPLTDSMPKALVPVGGKPLLWHVVDRLKQAGFVRIVINVHHFADQIIDYVQANNNFGLDIRISDEREKLLETGGGIRKAFPLFDADSPVLIHNVDILSNVGLHHLYSHIATADALLLVSRRSTSRYLLFNSANNLVGWTNVATGEKRGPIVDNPQTAQPFAFSGIHVVAPRLLQRMQAYPERFPIVDFYLNECATANIQALVMPDLQLMDVGKQETLSNAEQFLHNLAHD